MADVAIVFQITPECLTIHITDQPKDLIDCLLRTHDYVMGESVVINLLYKHRIAHTRVRSWDAVMLADAYHIGAYWVDGRFVHGEIAIRQFAKRATKCGRAIDVDDALMILYSHELM